MWRHWLTDLSAHHTLVRYDERGCGLSDHDVEFSFDAWVADLEAVVDAAGLDRFALLGVSQGGAVSIAYTARHPERVSHLVLVNSYLRGRYLRAADETARRDAELQVEMASDVAVTRRLPPPLRAAFPPGGSPGLGRSPSCSGARRRPRTQGFFTTHGHRTRVARGSVPTLVLRRLARPVRPGLRGRIAGSRLVPSTNHLFLPEEPAWDVVRREIEAFLAT